MRKFGLYFLLSAVLSCSVFAATSEAGPPKVVLNPSGTGAGATGELKFKELVANGQNYTGFKAPDSLAGNPMYTLPTADGTGGYVLSTNGSGVLSWVANGLGSVSSVAISMPSEFSVSGSPVTTSGTFTVTKANQSANTVFAGPTSGGAAAPAFRALVEADIGTNTVNTGAIKDANVTLAKIENITTDRLLGRDTTGSGVTEQLTVGGGVEFTGSGGIQRSALTGDVTASAGSNSTSIASGAVTLAKLESRARPTENFLINGGMDVFQRPQLNALSTGSNLEGLYVGVDRWFWITNAGGAGTPTYTFKQVDAASEGTRYAVEVGHSGGTNSRYMCLSQVIESSNAIPLRGRTVRFQARIKQASSTATWKAVLINWTGSAENGGAVGAMPKNLVNNWSSTTYTEGNFFTTNASYDIAAVGSDTSVGTSYTDVSVTGTISSSANNIYVALFCITANHTNATITKCGLYDGVESRDWLPKSLRQELADSQRYCIQWNSDAGGVRYLASGHSYTSTASQVIVHLPTPLRTTPTLAISAFGDWSIYDAAATAACSAISVSHATGTAWGVQTVLLTTTNGTLTTNRPVMLYATAAADKYIRFESEL